MKFLLGWPIFRGYISFREGISRPKTSTFFFVRPISNIQAALDLPYLGCLLFRLRLHSQGIRKWSEVKKKIHFGSEEMVGLIGWNHLSKKDSSRVTNHWGKLNQTSAVLKEPARQVGWHCLPKMHGEIWGPKDHLTLQWKGLGPQNSQFWGVKILRGWKKQAWFKRKQFPSSFLEGGGHFFCAGKMPFIKHCYTASLNNSRAGPALFRWV